MIKKPVVAVIGAGFGGLAVARALKGADVEVHLIDSRNHHIFQPLLYQVATAGLEPEEIAHAIRGEVRRQANVRFRMARVVSGDLLAKLLVTATGESIAFDYLVLAAGAVTNDFGISGVAEHAFGLKSLEDAIALRSHIVKKFEEADALERKVPDGMLTFVVAGGGPTGVEMAGALTELFDKVLRKDFPNLDFGAVRVVLLEALDRLLPPFDVRLQQYTLATLKKFGVDVRFGAQVISVTTEGVTLKDGSAIPAKTVVWGAGITGNPLASHLALPMVRGGRVAVNDDLTVPGIPGVFVIGDLAAGKDVHGNVYPQLAQAAIQGGKHVAFQIVRQINNLQTQPFAYKDPGFMATIGRQEAVAQFPSGLKVRGAIAWIMWLFLHLLYLVGFRNRTQVLINWIWSYFSYERGARLIMWQ